MGGFSGGHHGFSGGHHGFSGGNFGGFSGGHHGLRGVPSGAFSSGGHHGGLPGATFRSVPSLGNSHIGRHSGLGGTNIIQHNPNSFTTRHLGGATVTHGFRGVNQATPSITNQLRGAHAQSLLGHAPRSLGNGATFLHHHGLNHSLGKTGPIGTTGPLGTTGPNSLHHHGNWNGAGMHHHRHGGFYPYFYPYFGFSPFAFGWGWPYYGSPYGYGYSSGYFGYNPNCYYGGYGGSAYAYPSTATAPATTAAPTTATAADDAKAFAEKGEADFRSGDYKAAVYAWRHAVVDDPQNGVLTMMLGQALFATGQFDEAAGATQQAMQLLAEDQWGVVVKNFRELYGNAADYTTQLRALEKEVKGSGDKPATRFLLGFHYGYLGYPSHAVKQLDKTIKLAPQDQMAQRLREIMAGPKPGDQKPGDQKPGDNPQDDAQDAGKKAVKDGQPPQKSGAGKEAVDI